MGNKRYRNKNKKAAHENQNQVKPLIVVTTGGSGGHIFPAESICNALIQQGYEVAFITDKRGQNFASLPGVKTYKLISEAVARRTFLNKVVALAKLFLGSVQALVLLQKLKPEVVIGVGGYASFPAVLAAHLWRIPIILHEQNAVLGRANRILAKGSRLIATSFMPTRLGQRLTGAAPIRPMPPASPGTRIGSSRNSDGLVIPSRWGRGSIRCPWPSFRRSTGTIWRST